MYWFWGIPVGIAIGVAIGYEELEKRIKSRIKIITGKYNIMCTDKDGNEVPFDIVIKEIFKKGWNY